MPRLVAIQLRIEDGYPCRNLANIRSVIHDSNISKGDIVCLPELVNTGYDWDCINGLTQRDISSFTHELSQLTREKQFWLAGCGMAEIAGDCRFNSSFSIDPSGSVFNIYRKIHLFTPMNEDKYFRSGNSMCTAQCAEVAVGVGICYDLRFPELFRALTLGGSRVIVLPSQWPSNRLYAWNSLIRARAIENQCYFVGCNRAGFDSYNAEYGYSMIVAPNGEVISEANDAEETVLTAEFNNDSIEQIRNAIPSLQERRPNVYKLDFEFFQDALANEYDEM